MMLHYLLSLNFGYFKWDWYINLDSHWCPRN